MVSYESYVKFIGKRPQIELATTFIEYHPETFSKTGLLDLRTLWLFYDSKATKRSLAKGTHL